MMKLCKQNGFHDIRGKINGASSRLMYRILADVFLRRRFDQATIIHYAMIYLSYCLKCAPEANHVRLFRVPG